MARKIALQTPEGTTGSRLSALRQCVGACVFRGTLPPRLHTPTLRDPRGMRSVQFCDLVGPSALQPVRPNTRRVLGTPLYRPGPARPIRNSNHTRPADRRRLALITPSPDSPRCIITRPFLDVGRSRNTTEGSRKPPSSVLPRIRNRIPAGPFPGHAHRRRRSVVSNWPGR